MRIQHYFLTGLFVLLATFPLHANPSLNFISSQVKKENNLRQGIDYRISFSRPFTHYCEVEMNFGVSGDSVEISMPVWTPGSYLVREFARHVEGFEAQSGNGKKLRWEKVNKNTWRISAKGTEEVRVTYKVYCNELTVRTSQINSDHAFLNGANVFMYVRGRQDEQCNVEVVMPAEWSRVSTGLRKTGMNTFAAENYDILVDSPMEIGNQEVLEFEVEGKKHYICLAGPGNYDRNKLVHDFKKIVEVQLDVFGDLPYQDYTFIVNLVRAGGGGLEHLNSFAVQFPRYNFQDSASYKGFLGLVSHEFFHLWNVKRIRPEALGPFDYDSENYTKGLWIAEGWTSFYDNLFVRRGGLFTDTDYYDFVSKEVNDVMKYKGRFVQSLEESSFDTWIKYYRRDENSNNSQISYYTKGALVAMMLNIEIIQASNGERSLDDVLKALYADYKRNKKRGYSDKKIKDFCENAAGKKLDEFWAKYVSGTDELPLNEYLNAAGLEVADKNEQGKVSLDADVRASGERLIITKVYAGGSAYESGLNAGDEIVEINGVKADKDSLSKKLSVYNIGDSVKVTVNRDDIMKEIYVKFIPAIPDYEIRRLKSPTTQQKKVYEKWIEG